MFTKILFPVDLDNSQFAEKAMKVAIQQARSSGASLHVVTVMPGFGMSMVGAYFPEYAMDKALKAMKLALQKYISSAVPEDIELSFNVLQGKPHKEIIKEAKEIGADLIVIPSHNHSKVDRALIGNCTSRVVEQAKISVMVIKP